MYLLCTYLVQIILLLLKKVEKKVGKIQKIILKIMFFVFKLIDKESSILKKNNFEVNDKSETHKMPFYKCFRKKDLIS